MKQRIILMMIVWYIIGLNCVTAQVSFSPPIIYNAGSNPYSVVAADINGDGAVDLITANRGSHNLIVLTNDGSGTFGSNATYFAGPYPQYVVAADVNGDGRVDLICNSTGDLMIYTNNGSGGFINSSNYNVGGSSPFWVLAADVNGDGKIGLITVNGNSVIVLTNSGNGNFGIISSLGAPFLTEAVADVNGDGKIDLIGARANSLWVLTNSGSGMFSLCSTSSLTTSWPGNIITMNVNGDGKISVIVPDFGSGGGKSITVFTNDGTGQFGSNATYLAGNGPISVTAADVNGDGKMDLVCASEFGSTLTILTNNGNGGFGSNTTINVESAWVTTADVNGDGKEDLITLGNTVSVLINNSAFPPPNSTPTLNINTLSNGMLVSWPSASAGWSLQQNTNLATPDWSPGGYSGYPVTDNGTNKSLIITPALGNLFFRLLHP